MTELAEINGILAVARIGMQSTNAESSSTGGKMDLYACPFRPRTQEQRMSVPLEQVAGPFTGRSELEHMVWCGQDCPRQGGKQVGLRIATGVQGGDRRDAGNNV